ncbi:LADA_0F04346g1_1 [Lachancea dasiensis]|uniref:LADA_0F04346g1_1 n=1 Tax=Lachancea dasiensis TaxID=1072105 RepID=A0A1G4JJI4_9SACH|nr:LADA_0F04346g1_1 [Lachancea dasiensis]
MSEENGSEVFGKIKTHFPPAKIKKIMQTDEDIGKVSQATPVITGRSLEFFIAMLVNRSGHVAKDMGCRRISGDVMKKTIMSDEKFDFLRELVCGEHAKPEPEEEDEEE